VRAAPSPFRSDLLAGKVALVTGGASGIGLAISRALVDHGAGVVLVSRSQERLAAAAKDLGNASYHAADVRDRERLAEIAKAVTDVDILVNAAAGNFPVPFSAMSPGAWDSVLGIVLDGTANVCRSFAPHLQRALQAGRDPSIVNVVAGYAWTGAPGVSHSGAAKAGVLNLTRSLAVEWAPIRCNAVSPGPIADTEGMKRLGDELGLVDALMATVPLRRMGQADEVARACLYLASPAASYVTGHCLVVDGGQDVVGPFGGLWRALQP
jgi:NAD(P)-dependent dehydrogenase (short-subunit alcohol dehydrogenase family)